MAAKDRLFDEQILNSAMDYWRLSVEENKRGFAELSKAIGELTLNVGQLATQQKQTAKNIEELRLAIREQSALAQTQAQNIAELTKLATALITRN